MQLQLLRIFSIIAIALVYMLFDVFNKRNVPSVFAYATLAYGAVLTILYLNYATVLISAAAALAVLGFGYIVYKIGQLGLADVIELAAISLILPVLSSPILLSGALQFNLPFVLSLAINTGIVAIIMVPIYYIPISLKALKKQKKPVASLISKKNVLMAVLLAVAYAVFILFVAIVVRANYIGIAILSIMLISSFFVMLFSVPITHSMVEYVGVRQFEEGDIIATNLIDKSKIDKLKGKIKGFGRLVTPEMINEMKKKEDRRKAACLQKGDALCPCHIRCTDNYPRAWQYDPLHTRHMKMHGIRKTF